MSSDNSERRTVTVDFWASPHLIGYETPTLNNIAAEFVLVPFVASFVALMIVKAARYLSTTENKK